MLPYVSRGHGKVSKALLFLTLILYLSYFITLCLRTVKKLILLKVTWGLVTEKRTNKTMLDVHLHRWTHFSCVSADISGPQKQQRNK